MVNIHTKFIIKFYQKQNVFILMLLIFIAGLTLSVDGKAAEHQGNALLMLTSNAAPVQKIVWFEKHAIELDALSNIHDRAKAYQLIGQAYYQTGDLNNAEEKLQSSLSLLENKTHVESMQSAIYNDLGLLMIARENFKRALTLFKTAFNKSRIAQDVPAQIISTLNVVQTSFELGNTSNTAAALKTLNRDLDTLPVTVDTAKKWLSLGQLYRQGVRTHQLNKATRLEALKAYNRALTIAQKKNNKAIQSLSTGYIGELYADEQRYHAALKFSRQALFFAQEVSDDILLYRWQSQQARILAAQGDRIKAIQSYRQALDSLDRSRTQFTSGSGHNYKHGVAPVFTEFSNLLLKQSSEINNEEGKQAALHQIIDVLEAAKLAEIENYFGSACALPPQQNLNLTEVSGDSAIIYPILFKDRVELIVQLPTEIKQFTSSISADELRVIVNQFRQKIERYDADHRYVASAQLLYKWLIKPAEEELIKSGINTLVFVPDGPLRSIPMSALHDGEQFLIEKFAIATTPGITITDPKPFRRRDVRVLANGLSTAVQGYSALPSVKQELKNIQAVFNTRVYQDNHYQLESIEDELTKGDYSIVHFATHGEFNSDPKKSFLLTHDSKLTMGKLENTIGLRRFQSEPIDLLVLSACQTAVGDEKAALGLAGVAIKAGARSALATLWFINDQATSQLVADFYRELSKENQSKAKALQLSQVKMLRNTRFTHPSFWAPFLLIGNWL